VAVGNILYGALFACWTVGMVFGALAVSRRVPARSTAPAALVAIGLQGAGVGLSPAWLAAAFVGVM
jgi:hypothetical protein